MTGASRGVGRSTAMRLAELGAAVVINYSSSEDEAKRVADEITDAGGRAILHRADVSDDTACRKMMAAAKEAFGRLDIVVNNAGATAFIAHSNLEAVTDETWNRILGVNLKGPFQCIRAAAPIMRESGGGTVVNGCAN